MSPPPPESARPGVFALLGSPVQHSLSPAMYNSLFRSRGLDAVYVALEVGEGEAREALDAVRRGELSGVSLTAPLKVALLDAVDSLAATAARAGAQNVVTRGLDGALTGHNTDGEGLVASLGAVPEAAVVLGAGGTGRAVAAALLDAGARRVAVLNRTERRAADVARALSRWHPAATVTAGPLSPAAFRAAAEGAALAVNCTAGAASPTVATLDPAALSPGGQWVDVNYWQPDPPLARACAAAGVTFTTGHAMLAYQGALAFALFTGHPVVATDALAALEAR